MTNNSSRRYPFQPLWSGFIPLLFAGVMCFAHLGQGTLAVDAIRYADVSRQLSEHVPFASVQDGYRGTTYVNKPPLLFALTAQAFRVLGRSTFTAKAPAVMFVFFSLLLLYRLASREYGIEAGYWALGLAVANRSFTRDLVDFSFEGIALFGMLLSLAGALDLVSEEGAHPKRSGILLGIGVLTLTQSKLPYVLFVFAPLAVMCLLRMGDRISFRQRAFRADVFLPLVALTLLGGASYVMAGSDYRAHAFNNQLVEPFNMYHGYWTNLLKWSRSFFLTQAPLSWTAVAGAYIVLQKKAKTNKEILLLLWAAQALPLMFFVANRPRYLWPPLAAGALLGADYMSRRFQISAARLRIALLTASVLLVLLVASGVRLHRANPLVVALRNSPALAEQQLSVCVAARTSEETRRAVQQTTLLLQFELNRQYSVFSPGDIPEHTDRLLGDAGCKRALQWSGTAVGRDAFIMTKSGSL